MNDDTKLWLGFAHDDLRTALHLTAVYGGQSLWLHYRGYY